MNTTPALKRLTPKRERFCQAIVKGQNQSDAYRTAFNANKCTSAVVHNEAAKLMLNREIAVRIEEIRGPVIANLRWALEDRLRELRYAGQLDPIDFYDENGQLKAMKDIPEHARRAIAGFEVDPETGTTKVKLIDKRGAIMDYTKLAGDMPAERLAIAGECTLEFIVGLIQRKEPTEIQDGRAIGTSDTTLFPKGHRP